MFAYLAISFGSLMIAASVIGLCGAPVAIVGAVIVGANVLA